MKKRKSEKDKLLDLAYPLIRDWISGDGIEWTPGQWRNDFVKRYLKLKAKRKKR